MANPLTPVSAISQHIEENLVILRYQDYPLTNLLSKVDAYDNNIRWNVNPTTSTNVVGSLVTADAANPTGQSVVNANLSISDTALRTTVSMIAEDEQQARNSGVGQLKALLNETFEGALREMRETINTCLFRGTGTHADSGIIGLADVAWPNRPDYAGIAVADYPNWMSSFQSNLAGNPITSELLEEAEYAVYEKGTGNFTHLVCSPNVHKQLVRLFKQESTLMTSSLAPGDLGVSQISYMGRPIIMDRNASGENGNGGFLYFIDANHIRIHSRPYDGSQGMQRINDNGVNYTLKELPSNSSYVRKFELGCQLQLQVRDRRAVGYYAGANPTMASGT